MSKNLETFWKSKNQDTEHEMRIIREDLDKTKEAYSKSIYAIDKELKKLSTQISNNKGRILDELRTKIKNIKYTLDTFEDEFDSIDRQLLARDKTIGLRLDAIEETLYHMQKKESND